ncbi:Sugar transporter STL1 [Vanrija pseudolonga]|uniref:Sugar transporter STL1 n=1 Tax=Vanrija pseudolonga TaxID=143232 RepID=A0AAF0YAQ0_9TREE|nr:Sugar transporter STL1 [Vanrija pseudolonga]
MGGLLTGDAWVAQFPEINTNKGANGSSSLQGTVVAIYEIGCLFGSLIAFAIGDYLGRRRMIMLGSVILIIGAALQTAAYGIPQFIVGRIVAGIGNGINTSTVPLWHSETTRAHNRGRAVATELAINTFGTMSSYWIDYGFSFVKNQSQFRAPLGFQMAFAIVTLVLIQWCPESPRWLLSRGRDADAQAVLRQLSVEPLAYRDAVVDAEFKQITEWIAEEKAALVRDGKPISQFRACFTNGKDRYFHRLVLGMGSQFMQQLCGINAIAYYSAVIFEQSVGLARNTSLLLAGGNGIVNHLASIPPIFIIDRIGRRKLMIWSVAGQAVCMALMAGGTSRTAHGPGIVATTGIFFFSFFFASGLLSVPWLYPTEIAPLPIRTCSAALGSASNWIWNFVVVEITPISLHSIGYKTYIYFAIFNALFVPLIYFFYPETRQLSLENVDLLFTGPKVLMHLPEELRVPEPVVSTTSPQPDVEKKGDSGSYVVHAEFK